MISKTFSVILSVLDIFLRKILMSLDYAVNLSSHCFENEKRQNNQTFNAKHFILSVILGNQSCVVVKQNIFIYLEYDDKILISFSNDFIFCVNQMNFWCFN